MGLQFNVILVPKAHMARLLHRFTVLANNSQSTFHYNLTYFIEESQSDDPVLLSTPSIVKIFF
jgi:hypothetical protein